MSNTKQSGESDGVQDPVMKRRATELFATAEKAPDPDYAVTLYLQGLAMFPDAVEEGHKKLYEAAMRRKQRGGKAPGMLERAKWEMTKLSLEKDPKAGMLKAEEMWAKDPANLEYIEIAARCATKGGFVEAANWICGVLMSKVAESKSAARVFRAVADLYRDMDNAAKQVEALELYVKLKPDDGVALRELKDALARKSIQSGRFEGKATENIDERLAGFYKNVFDQDTHKVEARDKAIADAKAEYEKDPGNVAKVRKYANALVDKGGEASEAAAIALLEDRFKTMGDYSLKQRADDIRVRQLDRRREDLLKRLGAEPENQALKAEAVALVAETRKTKLAIYREQHKQYPTDNEILYKLGVELYDNKLYDEAIPAFQQAANEPRIQIDALYWLGMSFAMNGMVEAAIDEFKEAIGKYEMEKDDRSKKLHYSLGRCYEQNNRFAEAADEYKLLARWDYNYMDVRDRLKAVGEKVRGA
jgi:tetratricopeptide (TPR) repeat protein